MKNYAVKSVRDFAFFGPRFKHAPLKNWFRSATAFPNIRVHNAKGEERIAPYAFISQKEGAWKEKRERREREERERRERKNRGREREARKI